NHVRIAVYDVAEGVGVPPGDPAFQCDSICHGHSSEGMLSQTLPIYPRRIPFGPNYFRFSEKKFALGTLEFLVTSSFPRSSVGMSGVPRGFQAALGAWARRPCYGF